MLEAAVGDGSSWRMDCDVIADMDLERQCSVSVWAVDAPPNQLVAALVPREVRGRVLFEDRHIWPPPPRRRRRLGRRGAPPDSPDEDGENAAPRSPPMGHSAQGEHVESGDHVASAKGDSDGSSDVSGSAEEPHEESNAVEEGSEDTSDSRSVDCRLGRACLRVA